MKKGKSILLLAFVLLLAVAPAALAQESPDEDTITSYVAGDRHFDTFAAAVEAAGFSDLLSSGEWTLFAPTDLAFLQLGLTPDNIAEELTTQELVDLLTYHLLQGDKSVESLKAMLGEVEMENGALAGLKYYEEDVYINDFAKLSSGTTVGNGRVFSVDTVVQGPWPRVEAPTPSVEEAFEAIAAQVAGAVDADAGQVQEAAAFFPGAAAEAAAAVPEASAAPVMPAIPADSIAGTAVTDGRFDTLIAAAFASGLVDELAGGQWTAFAPTDHAFAKLGLSAGNIATAYSRAELADLLRYHLLAGDHSTDSLKAMLGDVTMANGRLAGLKYYEGDIYVNDDARVIEPNIVTGSGTFHVVDSVILPPWPRE